MNWRVSVCGVLCAQGEAQKIEKILEEFAREYSVCNQAAIYRHFNSSDTLFLLAYATAILNTDLHSRSIRPDKKMKLQQFVLNLSGLLDCFSLRFLLLLHCFTSVRHHRLLPHHLGTRCSQMSDV